MILLVALIGFLVASLLATLFLRHHAPFTDWNPDENRPKTHVKPKSN
jgi:hypothetical protein